MILSARLTENISSVNEKVEMSFTVGLCLQKKRTCRCLLLFWATNQGLNHIPKFQTNNMLLISSLGYSTPHGLDIGKAYGNGITWPMLYNTVCGFKGGYSDWLVNALTVIKFIEDENLADTNKLIFAGTSNGGAMALILASYYGNRCLGVCAYLPFLIGHSTRRLNDVIYNFPPPSDIRFRPSEFFGDMMNFIKNKGERLF